jgi:hypothetical protein
VHDDAVETDGVSIGLVDVEDTVDIDDPSDTEVDSSFIDGTHLLLKRSRWFSFVHMLYSGYTGLPLFI